MSSRIRNKRERCEGKEDRLTAMKTQQRLTYGLRRSPMRANFQNMPKTLRYGQYWMRLVILNGMVSFSFVSSFPFPFKNSLSSNWGDIIMLGRFVG